MEFEIAMRIGRDTPGEEHTAHSVRTHVDGVCAGIEIVDDRHADYKTLDVRGLVADNSWNEGMVLSPWVSPWPDLGAARRRGARQRPGGGPRLRPRRAG